MLDKAILSQIKDLAKTVRGLSIDGVQAANSGHPGLPLGTADIGALLFASEMKHDPNDPSWIDRDRFVLSAGHGSMLIYSLTHLLGYALPLDELKKFRQLGSRTAGHPEYGLVPGVETTTGPLGAGFANAVGMAVAETRLAALFNTGTQKVVDHYTYVLAGDGCMMEGVSQEAASLAGHLGLGKLIVIYDSNRITIEGHTDLAFTEDTAARFAAYGWHVLHADGYDHEGLAKALDAARAETGKPTLIVAKTIIGFGSPNKADTHDVHGSPLGPDEVKATKAKLGLDPEAFFAVPDAVATFGAARAAEGAKKHAAWKELFASWARANPDKKALWDATFGVPGAGGMGESIAASLAAGTGPDLNVKGEAIDAAQEAVKKGLPAIAWPAFEAGAKMATRSASGASLQAAAAALPQLVGGSADLAPSNNTDLKGLGHYQKGSREGRNFHFGVREHAMGSVVNGMVLHGGLKVFGATFLVFADYMRPSIRLAAIMKIPSIFIFTHDSIWVGEDGPTHQPTEQLASLRAINGLEVLRPADAEETAFVWQLALEKGFGAHAPANAAHGHTHDDHSSHGYGVGPTALALTRQNLVVFAKPAGWQESVRKTGAYIAKEAKGGAGALKDKGIVILATGSELGAALTAAQTLEAEGKNVRVISVPSLDRLRAVRKKVIGDLIPQGALAFATEAGNSMSWAGIVHPDLVLGLDGFGECGPGEKVANYFGLNADGLVALVKASS